MKVIAIVVLALITVVSCDPVQISDNNVGDIITVGINAKADISNNVDVDIVNVIVALLNQQADISRLSAPLAESEVSEIFNSGVPLSEGPIATPAENVDESAGVISQEALNHFVRVLPSGFQL